MRRTLSRVSDFTLVLLSAFAVMGGVIGLAACAPRHSIDAVALHGVLGEVLNRHDAYVTADPALSETQRRTYLRSSELTRAMMDEALEGTGASPAPAPTGAGPPGAVQPPAQ